MREEVCVYQHILWRRFLEKEVQEYELQIFTNRVNFAPFHALQCIHLLDFDNGAICLSAKGLIIYNTYVDDISISADSVKDLLAIQKDIVHILQRSYLKLKKWASNCDAILNCVPVNNHAKEPTFIPTDDASLKVLEVCIGIL